MKTTATRKICNAARCALLAFVGFALGVAIAPFAAILLPFALAAFAVNEFWGDNGEA